MSNEKIGHHTHLKAEDLHEYVLLPGSPERVVEIAGYLEEAREVASYRGFMAYVGKLDGKCITVISTSMGCPNVAIVFHELLHLANGRSLTLIRVGTAGSLQRFVDLGHLTISSASVRDEGTTRKFVPPEFPAVADLDVTLALRQAARQMGYVYHLGVTHSKDAFDAEEPDKNKVPLAEANKQFWKMMTTANVLSTEMEGAAFFILAYINRENNVRAGMILTNVGLTWGGESFAQVEPTNEAAIRTALEAILILRQAE